MSIDSVTMYLDQLHGAVTYLDYDDPDFPALLDLFTKVLRTRKISSRQIWWLRPIVQRAHEKAVAYADVLNRLPYPKLDQGEAE